ncbi:hypothetical protein DERP_005107 [Dermatophagoides pteronyssinus]|uniref:Uncharacterized protein n=1 Tax=Dermatophagoides pteronyssinus TaxID=6956 RepID=A0ABQ8JTE3_DERPT|nr:hypothetical protein DERP_005107 [Dermatophagoides pteronyssinus]
MNETKSKLSFYYFYLDKIRDIPLIGTGDGDLIPLICSGDFICVVCNGTCFGSGSNSRCFPMFESLAPIDFVVLVVDSDSLAVELRKCGLADALRDDDDVFVE